MFTRFLLCDVAVARHDLPAALHQNNRNLPDHGRVPEVQTQVVPAQSERHVPQRGAHGRLRQVAALAGATGSAASVRRNHEARPPQVRA